MLNFGLKLPFKQKMVVITSSLIGAGILGKLTAMGTGFAAMGPAGPALVTGLAGVIPAFMGRGATQQVLNVHLSDYPYTVYFILKAIVYTFF